MDIIKRNIATILLVIILLVVVIAIGALIATKRPGLQQGASPTPIPALVKSIDPTPLEGLSPGAIPTITLSLTRRVDPDTLTPVWTIEPITSNTTTALPVNVVGRGGNTTLVITPNDSIQANATYTLVLLDKQTQQLVYQATYLSATPPPTRVATNNTALVQFLPHETDTYRLSYLPDQNIYVFNFIYNPDSDQPLEAQFDAARNQAIQFIQSKGIDSNSVVIDFRSS